MLILKRAIAIIGFFSFIVYLSLWDPWIKWDENNAELHSKEVTFTQSMNYITLTDAHIEYGLTDEEIKVGKILTKANSATSEGILAFGGVSIPIPNDTKFVIKRSYLRKYNWYSEPFRSGFRSALMEDELGNKAIFSFIDFTVSTSPEFSEYKWSLEEI